MYVLAAPDLWTVDVLALEDAHVISSKDQINLIESRHLENTSNFQNCSDAAVSHSSRPMKSSGLGNLVPDAHRVLSIPKDQR
jgi:hypothetical protein